MLARMAGRMEEWMTEYTPQKMPEHMPVRMPEKMPKYVPYRMSEECQKIFRNDVGLLSHGGDHWKQLIGVRFIFCWSVVVWLQFVSAETARWKTDLWLPGGENTWSWVVLLQLFDATVFLACTSAFFCGHCLTLWTIVNISGYHWHEHRIVIQLQNDS